MDETMGDGTGTARPWAVAAAGIWLLLSGCWLVFLAGYRILDDPARPLRAWLESHLDLLTGLIVIGAAFGLVRQRAWARPFAIFLLALLAVPQVAHLVLPLATRRVVLEASVPPAPGAWPWIFAWGAALLAVNVLLIVVLTRPAVVRAFRGTAGQNS